jgi:hypothetical protein
VNVRCYRDLQGSIIILLGNRFSSPEFMELQEPG